MHAYENFVNIVKYDAVLWSTMFPVPCGFATLCLALTSYMLYISTDHYKWTYTCNLTAKRSINIAWHILGDCLSVLILVFVSKWFLNKWTCIDEGNHIYRYLQVLYTRRCIAVIVLFQWIPYILLYIFTNSLPKRLIQIVYIIHTRNKHA